MSETPGNDPYALLGVAVDADAATIRAAYLRLIKELHPDRRREGEMGAGASALNEAYALLRNPERRRVYDLGRRKSAALPAVLAPRRPPPPPRPSRIGWWLGLPVVLALAWVAAELGQRAYEQTIPRISPSAEADNGERFDQAGPGGGWVDGAMIGQAVDSVIALRAGGRTAEIERYSRTCSAQFESDPNPLRADHCIAFDIAAATLQAAGKTSAVPPEQALRHVAMLRRLSGEPVAGEMRLREIRAETVSAIARRLSVTETPDRGRR